MLLDKLLPRLQLILAVGFAALALFGPALISDAQVLIPVLVVFGLLFAATCLGIAWHVLLRQGAVVYPFTAWSVQVLKVLAGEEQVRPLTRPNRLRHGETDTTVGPRWLGLANLALGILLLVAMLGVGIALLLQ